MGYEVVTTPAFDARLEEAVAYRMAYVGRGSASKLLTGVESAASRLASFPEMGTELVVHGVEGLPRRWVLVRTYVVVYVVRAAEQVVQLEDLFYGGENWRERFEGESLGVDDER